MINIYFNGLSEVGETNRLSKIKAVQFRVNNPTNYVTVVTWSRLMPVNFVQMWWHLKNPSIECRSYKINWVILKRWASSRVKTSKLPGLKSAQAWQLPRRSRQHITNNSISILTITNVTSVRLKMVSYRLICQKHQLFLSG